MQLVAGGDVALGNCQGNCLTPEGAPANLGRANLLYSDQSPCLFLGRFGFTGYIHHSNHFVYPSILNL